MHCRLMCMCTFLYYIIMGTDRRPPTPLILSKIERRDGVAMMGTTCVFRRAPEKVLAKFKLPNYQIQLQILPTFANFLGSNNILKLGCSRLYDPVYFVFTFSIELLFTFVKQINCPELGLAYGN